MATAVKEEKVAGKGVKGGKGRKCGKATKVAKDEQVKAQRQQIHEGTPQRSIGPFIATEPHDAKCNIIYVSFHVNFEN
jgi:hypothetical protein